MPDIVEVAEKIYRIQVMQAGLAGSTIYLVADGAGAVIDPGFGACVPFILDTMRHLGMKELSYILPTHVHVDHAGGAGDLARQFPKSRVVVHPSGREHMADPSRLIESTKKSYGTDFEARMGTITAVPAEQIAVPEDGAVIDLGQRQLRVIYTPGHSPHHIAFLDLKTHGLFAGEALGMRSKSRRLSPLPNAAPPAFDPEKYLESIALLKRLQPRMIFYAHDGVARDSAEMPLLFDNLSASTIDICRMIQDMVRQGKGPAAVEAAMRQHVEKVLGQDLAGLELSTTVAGIDVYYRRAAANG